MRRVQERDEALRFATEKVATRALDDGFDIQLDVPPHAAAHVRREPG